MVSFASSEASEALLDPLTSFIADDDFLLPDNSVPENENFFSRKIDTLNLGT